VELLQEELKNQKVRTVDGNACLCAMNRKRPHFEQKKKKIK
jgi:hypothetical protein